MWLSLSRGYRIRRCPRRLCLQPLHRLGRIDKSSAANTDGAEITAPKRCINRGLAEARNLAERLDRHIRLMGNGGHVVHLRESTCSYAQARGDACRGGYLASFSGKFSAGAFAAFTASTKRLGVKAAISFDDASGGSSREASFTRSRIREYSGATGGFVGTV